MKRQGNGRWKIGNFESWKGVIRGKKLEGGKEQNNVIHWGLFAELDDIVDFFFNNNYCKLYSK